MKDPARKRGTAPRQSKGRTITDNEVNAAYNYLQGAVKVEYPDGLLPELHGPTSIPPRRKKVAGSGSLPHPDDVRAVIKRALETLEREKSRRPELRYLRLALRRHVELGLSLDQAFGYAKVGKGPPPALNEERSRRIACAVFEERFINGWKAEVAGDKAGKLFSVGKTKALKAFADHDAYAFRFHKLQRIQKQRNPLWTKTEKQHLTRYYTPDGEKTLDKILAEVDESPAPAAERGPGG